MDLFGQGAIPDFSHHPASELHKIRDNVAKDHHRAWGLAEHCRGHRNDKNYCYWSNRRERDQTMLDIIDKLIEEKEGISGDDRS